jgi:hypothetical protein
MPRTGRLLRCFAFQHPSGELAWSLCCGSAATAQQRRRRTRNGTLGDTCPSRAGYWGACRCGTDHDTTRAWVSARSGFADGIPCDSCHGYSPASWRMSDRCRASEGVPYGCPAQVRLMRFGERFISVAGASRLVWLITLGGVPWPGRVLGPLSPSRTRGGSFFQVSASWDSPEPGDGTGKFSHVASQSWSVLATYQVKRYRFGALGRSSLC